MPPFQAFLDEHREVVFRFLVALVGRQEAEDCFQETFLAALRGYPRLRDASNLRSWILTIAHRKGIDALRAEARRPSPREDLPERPAPPESDGAVWEAVRALPPKQRGAVFLRYGVGLPYREVATVLGNSEAAARQNVREGFRNLREVLR